MKTDQDNHQFNLITNRLKGKMIIAVIGAGQPTKDIYQLALEVGEELGKRHMTVICGGMGGVMEAVCKGTKSTGGFTIGVLPGDKPYLANQWVDIPICTGMSDARNVIIVKTGTVVISIGGSYGTLSEIGHALSDSVPVIGLNTWNLSRDNRSDKTIVISSGAKDAVQKAIKIGNHRLKTTSNLEQINE
mgnify:FL=1|tara:strand:- start:1278 stop:1844 length:567 start_codon:yes stop_codon:yes gene_type:complete